MSEDTNENTTIEKKSSKKTSMTKTVVVASVGDAIDSFPFEMLEIDKTSDLVDPKSLIFPPFDSRSDTDVKLEPSFAEDIKNNGVLQPPLVTPVRDKKTGKSGLLIVAGRRRVEGAIEAANEKNKLIPVYIKTMTLKEAVIACGIENIKRKNLSFWDEASYMRMLRDDFGMKQTDIKDKLGVADSKVSQYLAVFDLDERVQKLVRKGQLDPGANTKVRALKAVTDPDMQYGLAVKAIEAGWNSDDIEEAVKRLEAKIAQAEKAKKEREKAKKAAGVEEQVEKGEEEDTPTFDIKAITLLKKAEYHALLESTVAQLERMRAKDDVNPEKLAFVRGKLEGLKLATGFKALPKSLASEE